MFKTGPTVILPNVEDRPVVGSYSTAEQADKAVAFLADNGFPVERAGIVGHDLRLVETVLGRASAMRAAGTGAATGMWFGLMFGLLIPLFIGEPAMALMLGGMAYGALFGATFGLISHTTARGRGFLSRRDLVADRYDIVVDAGVVDEARNLLAKHNWRT